MNQPTLFEKFREPMAKPIATGPPDDLPRLHAQCHAILARLREGPATNVELGEIGQRFGARLYDLKRAGYGWTKRRVRPGVWEYRLTNK